ncbi:LysR family transcriptional regulator [Rhodococcus sp. NPDC058521]|uniref:LysR family transcriptional regulator n=1 Tax=Rhodococcus sp. NPDC058521 TaxID=3346536 RepID=UPI003665B16F
MIRAWPDLAVLELLVRVDELGSLGSAARRVGMAQPNASRAVKQLETHLGAPLLMRSTRGSTLTPQGTVIVHWAREVLADAARLLDAAEALRAQRQAELTVGASMTVAEHLVPNWLAEFHRHHADVQVHLQVHNSTEVFERTEDGRCDVGFVESPTVPRSLHSAAVATDRLVVVVHPAHPWVRRRRSVGIAELAGAPLVVREPGSGTRTTLDVALIDRVRPLPLLELGSAAAIRTSVIAGVGPAVMSTLAVSDQVASGEMKIVPVEGLDLTRTLRAVWRPPRRLDGPAGELVSIARSWRA